MDEDKRAYSRFLYSEPVAYGAPEVTVNGGVAGNISIGGLSLRVQEFVPMGIVLELQIRLGHSSKVIWAKAKVVRVREVLADECYEIGLKFIRDDDSTRAISEYINARRSGLTG
jgi:hypothetical protein